MITIAFRLLGILMGLVYWAEENIISGIIVFFILAGIGQIFKKKIINDSTPSSSTTSYAGSRSSCNCPGHQGWQYYTSGVDTWQGYPARKRRCPQCGQRDVDYLEADMSARKR